MSKYKRQSHVVYKCDYPIVWVAKYRLRILTGEVGKLVDQDVRKLSEWLGCEVMGLNVQADHVDVVVSIPPKVSVSTYMGTIKGKIANKDVQELLDIEKKPYWRKHF